MGAYVALNTIIPYIKYDNVVVFGSDDVMMPNGIETLSKVDYKYDIVKFLYKSISEQYKKCCGKCRSHCCWCYYG